MRPVRWAVATLTALLLVGCTAAPDDEPAPPTPVTGATPTPTAVPSRTPSPSTTATPSPSPSATLPSREADSATLRKALVTSADLGKPWVQAGDPPAAEASCPRTRSALGYRATARRDLNRGAGELINGATFWLATLPSTDAARVRAWWKADTQACPAYTDADDYYVVQRATKPAAVPGADEVLFARVERVFFDRGDDEPAYARRTLVARTGRVVATVTYSFLTTAADPDAADLSAATELLQTQLTKAAAALPE